MSGSADWAGEAIGGAGAPGNLMLQWDESMAVMPSGLPRFLQPGSISEDAAWAGLDTPAVTVLQSVAVKVAGSQSLCQLAWHLSRRVFDAAPSVPPVTVYPALGPLLGRDADAFYALVALDLVPRLRRAHARLGIPETVTRDTCGQLNGLVETYRRANKGQVGAFPRQLNWLRHYIEEPFFRLGRFAYWLRPFWRDITVYRNRQTGETIALAPDGKTFTAEGYRNQADEPGQAGQWISRLVRMKDGVLGHPVTPAGKAIQQEVVLPWESWSCILQFNDWTLQMHIPPGGGMTPEGCRDSFRQADAFFSRYYPDQKARSITCESWIFSPILESILPPEANLVRLIREVYLLPVPSGPFEGLWPVYLQDDLDPARVPLVTRVQRAIAGYMASGQRWRLGGMCLMLEDMPGFGQQQYRRHWRLH